MTQRPIEEVVAEFESMQRHSLFCDERSVRVTCICGHDKNVNWLRTTLTNERTAQEERMREAVEAERERMIQITTTNKDAFMMPVTEQRWLNAVAPTKTDKHLTPNNK